MEADWAVEIGPGAPVIDALWSGFIDLRFDDLRLDDLRVDDLRFNPRLPSGTVLNRARSLAEAADLPALAEALVRLNSPHSPVWTSKCDVWSVDVEQIDPYELDANPQGAQSAQACYIDLLPPGDQHPPDGQQWTTPERTASFCKSLCHRLHDVPLSACRVDLVVRLAVLTPDRTDHGITAYLTACGPTATTATERLALALTAFTDVVSPQSR